MHWKLLFASFLLASQPLFGQNPPKSDDEVGATAPPAQALPSYEMSGTPDEGLLFVVKDFTPEQGPDVDAMVMAEARRRCAPKIALGSSYDRKPGKITVNGQTVIGIVRYERLALCADPRKPIAPAPRVFYPTPNDESDLRSAFSAYFRAFDASDVDALLPLRDYPAFPRQVLLKQISDYKLEYGEPKRTILKTSWYPNPPELHNGIFGEVLFSHPVSNTSTLCGAAMFYKRAEHDFLLSRVMAVEVAGPSKGADDLQSCSR